MSRTKSIIVVPYWVHETLRRNQLNIQACLNFDQIRDVFSQADLAGFLSVQNEMPRIIGMGSDDANGAQPGLDSWVLRDQWDKTATKPGSQEALLNTLVPMSYDPLFYKEARDRLFDAQNIRERDTEPFITYDLAPDVGAIVIYPGHFTSTELGDLQFRALQAIQKVLYVYNTYNEVARTPWFRQYLVGLSTKQIAA